jgi:ADP-heptose:LPS heptosyltransferase
MIDDILKKPKRVLMIRVGAIGNALVAVPAIRALKKEWPDAWFTLVADPVTKELLESCPYIDEIINYDNKGPEKAGPGYARFIMDLRKRKFTHAIMFRRYTRSEIMGFLSGAPVRVGFVTDSPLQLINKKVIYEEGANVIGQNLKLARALGVPAKDRALEYWPDKNSEKANELLKGIRGDGPLVIIHPAGSTQKNRLWPYFGELAKLMQSKLSAQIVFLGSAAEKDIVKETAQDCKTAIGWTFSDVSELIRRADIFIGTDSGPAHLADAVGTAGAIIYAPHKGMTAQLEKWKPEGDRYLAFVPYKDCEDCKEADCDELKQKECASSIDVGDVYNGVSRLFEKIKKGA